MIFWIFAAVLLPLVIACGIIYQQRVVAIKTEAFNKLTAIRDLKVSQLNVWLEERRNDLRVLSLDPETQKLSRFLNNKGQDDLNRTILESARSSMNAYMKGNSTYRNIFIINASNGIVGLSTDNSYEGMDMSNEMFFSEPLKTGRFYIRDIFYSHHLDEPVMCFSMPVFSLDPHEKKPYAIIVSQVDLDHSLYELLLDRTGMGKTGETLIINKDMIALNELRWFDRAPLKLKISANPAKLACQGNTGIIEDRDYRGVYVLAAYTFLPATQWGFVAKQDLSEIYTPIHKILINLAIILLFGVIFAYVLAHMLALNFSLPVLDITDAANKLQSGDLTARCTSDNNDEYGMLAQAFNGMAESMEAYKKSQIALRRLDEIVVSSNTVEGFGSNYIQKLADVTGSEFGAFYLKRPDQNEFNYVSSTGLDPELIKSLDSHVIEGAFNRARTTKKVTYIRDIPADTAFTINTIAGKAIPRCMVALPLQVNGQIAAMMTLGSLRDYSKAASSLLEQIRPGLSTALSNMLSGEKTALMAKSLKNKNMELEAQANELEAMTVSLKQHNEELDIQSKRLKEANTMKSEFLSNMSHELRTPLNSVMALSGVLKMNIEKRLGPEEVEYLDVIERNGRRLLDLINDILDLSKIEAGHMNVVLSSFSLTTLIENILDSLRPLAREKKLDLIMDSNIDQTEIQSDEKRVHQILMNLVGNAIKFTETGTVTVRVTRSDEAVFVDISDTGIGISEKDLAYIFEEFKQVDGSTSRRHEGTGLGLAIAQKISQKLGGSISVESKPGKGTTFTLTLPRIWKGHAMVGMPPGSPERPEIIKDQKTVLVVDDNPELVSILASYLLDAGYPTLTATSGPEAIRLAEHLQPFAITLDLIMPGMDGIETLQKLKKNPSTAAIPVIMISVSQDRKTGLALGAADHVTKPVLPDQLINAINQLEAYHKKRILVVEDNEAAMAQITMILEKEGYLVDMAKGDSQARDCVANAIPDGIILDLMMPDVDGFEVLEKIRGTEQTAEIPVLILTAKDLTPDDYKKLSANNIQQLVQKGDVEREGLLLKVKQMIGDIPRPAKPINPAKKPKRNTETHHQPLTEPGTRSSHVHRPRILVIEDNPDNLITLRAILKNGYDLIEVSNGETGLLTAFDESPDLILMDIALPDMDGYAIIKKLKAHETIRHIPVIALTAHAMKGDREAILSAGCDDYLSKPIDPVELFKTIDIWLGNDLKDPMT